MTTIEQLMTPTPFSLSEYANVHKARQLLAEHKIRHIPIISSDDGSIVGMLSQRRILKNAIKIINDRGMAQLEHMEKSMSVSDIMNDQPLVVNVKAKPLEVAQLLKTQKHGCVLVESENKLVGIVTSSDYVNLAISLLSS